MALFIRHTKRKSWCWTQRRFLKVHQLQGHPNATSLLLLGTFTGKWHVCKASLVNPLHSQGCPLIERTEGFSFTLISFSWPKLMRNCSCFWA